MIQRSRRVNCFDDTLERNITMLIRVQESILRCDNQVLNVSASARGQPQGQHIDKQADECLELGKVTIGHGCSEHQFL